uniref:Uncharacterized protein n=1 Tax=Rhizophora mucronata TaxID=61149 RepID=A0A2P2QSG2_RHIMU
MAIQGKLSCFLVYESIGSSDQTASQWSLSVQCPLMEKVSSQAYRPSGNFELLDIRQSIIVFLFDL